MLGKSVSNFYNCNPANKQKVESRNGQKFKDLTLTFDIENQ